MCSTLASCDPDDGPEESSEGSEASEGSETPVDSDAGETNPNTDGTTACEHATVDDCCCFETIENSFYGSPSIGVGCASVELCPLVLLGCPAGRVTPRLDCAPPELTLIQENGAANLGCALEAIAANEAGHVSFEITYAESPGLAERTFRLYVTGAEAAYVVGETTNDMNRSVTPVGTAPLLPQAERDPCAAATDVVERITCLVEAAAPVTMECPAGATQRISGAASARERGVAEARTRVGGSGVATTLVALDGGIAGRPVTDERVPPHVAMDPVVAAYEIIAPRLGSIEAARTSFIAWTSTRRTLERRSAVATASGEAPELVSS